MKTFFLTLTLVLTLAFTTTTRGATLTNNIKLYGPREAHAPLAQSIAQEIVDIAPRLEQAMNQQQLLNNNTQNQCVFVAYLNCSEPTITQPVCGDNIINQDREECDSSKDNDCNACKKVIRVQGTECGNGILEKGEACDQQDMINESTYCTMFCTLQSSTLPKTGPTTHNMANILSPMVLKTKPKLQFKKK